MNKILLALALAVPFLSVHEVNAAEGDFWLDVNVASYHTGASEYTYEGKTEDFNQFNYGLGISYEMDDLIEWEVGFFRNSYDKHSNYAAMKFKHDIQIGEYTVTPGLAIGGVTGYQDTEMQAAVVQPLAVPTVGISRKNARVVLGYLPLQLVSEDSETDVITLQFGYRFTNLIK